jgi:DNA polymerase IV
VWSCCEDSEIRGRTATLKAKYADFRQITRSRSLEVPIASRAVLEELVSQLLEPLFPVEQGIRLLGVTLSSLEAEGEYRVGQRMLLPI